MKRRQLLGGTAAVLAAPSLVRAAQDRVLRFVPEADITVIDPVWTTATVTRNHGYLVFDTLYAQDDTFVVRPQMVEGHTV